MHMPTANVAGSPQPFQSGSRSSAGRPDAAKARDNRLMAERGIKHFTFCLALGLLAILAECGFAVENSDKKAEETPCFWQQDKTAGFVDGGSNYCAPTAISNGLIYLAQARGMKGLVPGTGHDHQIALIEKLAREMDTDPKNGTSPDKIITGLRRYVEANGFRMKRLEVATWRGLSEVNRACSVGKKPVLEWLRAAAADPECVEVFNVGWYRKDENGFNRHSGHWVTVVNAGPGLRDFSIHNPLLRPDTQQQKKAVSLTMLDKGFNVINAEGKDTGNMSGYFQVAGPGLPLGAKTAAAVLDSVIVFSVQK